jgi:AbrB family looped-hinge helix DNA binding protein
MDAMSRVTKKLQVTIPKAIAREYGIRPGEDIEWIPAGDGIRVVPVKEAARGDRSVEGQLALFDAATARQRKRESARRRTAKPTADGRGWTREDLYARGRSR